MDFDDRTGTPRQPHNFAMEQTLTAPLNNTTDFLVIISFLVDLILIRSFVRSFIHQGSAGNLGQTTVDYEQMLDSKLRECKLSTCDRSIDQNRWTARFSPSLAVKASLFTVVLSE